MVASPSRKEAMNRTRSLRSYGSRVVISRSYSAAPHASKPDCVLWSRVVTLVGAVRPVAFLIALSIVALSTRLAFGYGEPAKAQLENHEERLLHVLTNQVRQDPHAWPDWDTSLATGEPRGPLFVADGLYEA